MKDLGTFYGLGNAWLAFLKELYHHGSKVKYSDNPGEEAEVKESMELTVEIRGPHLPDEIIERYKVQEEYEWMVRNFTVQEKVKELHNENSYAARLYAYMGTKNQFQWVIEKLRENPHTRSATITMFEPLADVGYISCVSLLDFQGNSSDLDLIVYCRALDFGCKAYVNLVMLSSILHSVSEKVGMNCGRLVLVVKSAHYYMKDEEKVLRILAAESV